MARRVLLLGSTGSIGTQALDVIRQRPGEFEVVGLSAGRNRELVAAQAAEFGVPSDHLAFGALESEALVRSVDADVVVNGITGSAGLRSTLAALERGTSLALANKESLVVGADLVRARRQPGQIVPVDSEHSAIAQCLVSGTRSELRRLVLTASGGPFRGKTREELQDVAPAQALAHPTWNMGRVVTTNSATLMNKGLEVIEAHVLFDVPLAQIDVVVHPQSMIHSMVEFVDGSTIAQVSNPDMRLPIALGLDWPRRIPEAVAPVDWTKAHEWQFLPLDTETFPAVNLAKHVAEAGSSYPVVFNAANEEAVDAFHEGKIGFLDIVDAVAKIVDEHEPDAGDVTLESLEAAEVWARQRARERLNVR
ncbi:1-deoxy-D-xylulose-5-phosphate reductoisomerase [Pseudoclavibacter alba]|uniref:1-deoxy-D-xylulose 5-phosphate reductoisomerase n=1 Tax=Pseudoclavibacter albus TaxID=272241 RepID=A0ABT2HWX7_9MICO|nr:1-deoxy-D-xylulose-5-phosphate reductoisomerase [Pseudoclavibacter alba]MBN6777772.1 1-deoxy-D-xylulose-5-phosphate reductoisomerase [Pseudoclavibacter alba]MCT2042818.1 1-deoxy-D-xylulose-5-phosphate reductoisomerase [Pseudoclavibacter alba]